MSDEKSQRIGRERIARVFRYLKALNEHRNPAKRDLSEQPWTLWFRNLPDHPSIQRRLLNGKDAEEDDFVLKVGRPTFTQAPQPPLPIADWLEGDWEDADCEVVLMETKGNAGSEPIRFDSEPRRVEAYERWRAQHQAWAGTERPRSPQFHLHTRVAHPHPSFERYQQIPTTDSRNYHPGRVSIEPRRCRLRVGIAHQRNGSDPATGGGSDRNRLPVCEGAGGATG